MNSYKKLCTEFYDIDKPAAHPEALAFYVRCAREAQGPILEPMCGSGRFLVPLAQRGFDIDGADASPQMLDACRAKCERLGLRPALQEQFLHQLDLPRRYALVMIPAGSFGLITDPEQARESLRRIRAHLVPGGRLVMELDQYRPGSSGFSPWGGRWVTRPGDAAKIIISWLPHHDVAARITRSVHRYDLVSADGRLLETEFEDFHLKLYELEEARVMLDATGFDQVVLTRPYTDTAPDAADDEFAIGCVAAG